jgi:hypothetical protein
MKSVGIGPHGLKHGANENLRYHFFLARAGYLQVVAKGLTAPSAGDGNTRQVLCASTAASVSLGPRGVGFRSRCQVDFMAAGSHRQQGLCLRQHWRPCEGPAGGCEAAL